LTALRFPVEEPVELRKKQAAFVHEETAGVTVSTSCKDLSHNLFRSFVQV
jgi:hypothetical protein